MSMSIEEFLKREEEKGPVDDRPSGYTCVSCEKDISFQESFEMMEARDGYMHNDCFFGGLGEIIEKYPICAPDLLFEEPEPDYRL